MTSKNRDFSLDILRAAACLMVMGVHLGQHITIPGAIGAFFEKGSTGVGFFFILSGYLAYFSLDKAFEKGLSTKQVMLEYWYKRAVHILPLYYLMILFYFILTTIAGIVPRDDTGLYWIRYIFFLNRWVPTDVEFWTNLGAVWSISVFVFFYLIVPFYYKVARNYYSAWIGVLVSFAVLKYTDEIALNMAPFRYMFHFFLGILIYLAVKEKKILSLSTVLCGILVFCALVGKGDMLNSPLIASMFIMATRGTVTTSSKNNPICRAISAISLISYSLYLDHAAVVTVLDIIGIKNAIVYLLIFVVSSFSLAIITYNLVEKKFPEIVGKLINGRKKD